MKSYSDNVVSNDEVNNMIEKFKENELVRNGILQDQITNLDNKILELKFVTYICASCSLILSVGAIFAAFGIIK